MQHPDVHVLLVTGGPGVVREALKTPKEGHHRRPRETRRPSSTKPPTWNRLGRDIVQRGIVRQHRGLHRREDHVRRRDRGRSSRTVDDLQMGHTGSRNTRLKRLERVIFKEMGPPEKPGQINPDVDRERTPTGYSPR